MVCRFARFSMSVEAFGKIHMPDPDNLESFYKDRTHEFTTVIGTMPGNHKDKYDAVELVDGFVAWNSYQIDTDENIPMNKKWAAWIKTLTSSGMLDDYALFI